MKQLSSKRPKNELVGEIVTCFAMKRCLIEKGILNKDLKKKKRNAKIDVPFFSYARLSLD